jgi:hypothetical protein
VSLAPEASNEANAPEAVSSSARPRLAMMMWTASPQRHHSAKAWSEERHKEGDRP